MRKLLFILSIIFFSCEKEPIECWVCETRYQASDELIVSNTFCDKEWGDMISIADSMNIFGITYTTCKKISHGR